MGDLAARQYVPMADDEKAALHRAAAKAGLSHGLLARLLLLHGLDHVDDPEMVGCIEQEKVAGRERISAGARVAARVRWGSGDDSAGESA